MQCLAIVRCQVRCRRAVACLAEGPATTLMAFERRVRPSGAHGDAQPPGGGRGRGQPPRRLAGPADGPSAPPRWLGWRGLPGQPSLRRRPRSQVLPLPHGGPIRAGARAARRAQRRARGAARRGRPSRGPGRRHLRQLARGCAAGRRAVAGRAAPGHCPGGGDGGVRAELHGLRRRGARPSGPVTWLSHSGSAFSALLHNDRGIRFNLAVSTGLELTTTMADYLAVALERPSTGVVAVFLETVRDPGAFREALAAAADRDVPVVALKVGREEATRDLVEAHSGALAGEDAAYGALFDAHGVVRVETLDELADTVELFAAGRRAGPGGLAAIHDSGGERAHLVDVAARVGVRLADISERTRDRLAARLDPRPPAVDPPDP